MVSPRLMRKSHSEEAMTMTAQTKRLFQAIYKTQSEGEKENDDTPKIKVSEVISKMSFYYEKIRNSVDYKEEYLLRKNAIERILKRQIVIEGAVLDVNSEKISKFLLTELIRAGYLPNNKIPEEKIPDIAAKIEKYIKLRNYSLARMNPGASLMNGRVNKANQEMKERGELTHWFIAIAASEIEESLGRDKVKQAVVASMYESLNKNIKLPDDSPFKKDLEIQIYLSIYRSYLKFDQGMLSFILFKYFNSNWDKSSDEAIAKIAQNIIALRVAVDKQLNHPLKKQLDKIVNRYTVFFTTFAEVIKKDPSGVYDSIKNDPKAFPRAIRHACNEKYKTIKHKLWRAATNSIIYIFLTKLFFALLKIKIPALQQFSVEVSPIFLAVDIGFPSFLLFLVALFTKIPAEENSKKIISGIKEIAFLENARHEPIILREPAKRGKLMTAIFNFIYIITFFISFGSVVWILDKINLTLGNIIVFLLFLALVSFLGIRIRRGVRDFIIVESKDNILSFLVDFFYTPIITVGKWLTEKFSQINIFVFILDFIIEAPFKIIVEITEEWTKYAKERKDDIV